MARELVLRTGETSGRQYGIVALIFVMVVLVIAESEVLVIAKSEYPDAHKVHSPTSKVELQCKQAPELFM